MDLLLRCMNVRGFLVAGGALAALALLLRFHDAPGRWYRDVRFAQEGGAAGRASDIDAELEARQSLKLKGLYRDVSAEIAASKARGLPVDGFQEAADAAANMDSPVARKLAIDSLNRLRVAIPQPPVAVGPSRRGDEPSDAPAEPPSKATAHRRRRARSR